MYFLIDKKKKKKKAFHQVEVEKDKSLKDV
jgi:hypothetical protein